MELEDVVEVGFTVEGEFLLRPFKLDFFVSTVKVGSTVLACVAAPKEENVAVERALSPPVPLSTCAISAELKYEVQFGLIWMEYLQLGMNELAPKLKVTTNQYCELVTYWTDVVTVVKVLDNVTVSKLLQIEQPLARMKVGIRLKATPWQTTPLPVTCPRRVRIELALVGTNWQMLTIALETIAKDNLYPVEQVIQEEESVHWIQLEPHGWQELLESRYLPLAQVRHWLLLDPEQVAQEESHWLHLLQLPNHPALQMQVCCAGAQGALTSHFVQIPPTVIWLGGQTQLTPFHIPLFGHAQREPLATKPALHAQAVPFQAEFRGQGWQYPLITQLPKYVQSHLKVTGFQTEEKGQLAVRAQFPSCMQYPLTHWQALAVMLQRELLGQREQPTSVGQQEGAQVQDPEEIILSGVLHNEHCWVIESVICPCGHAHAVPFHICPLTQVATVMQEVPVLQKPLLQTHCPKMLRQALAKQSVTQARVAGLRVEPELQMQLPVSETQLLAGQARHKLPMSPSPFGQTQTSFTMTQFLPQTRADSSMQLLEVAEYLQPGRQRHRELLMQALSPHPRQQLEFTCKYPMKQAQSVPLKYWFAPQVVV